LKSNRNSSELPWSDIHAARAHFRKAFPRVSKLPIIPSTQDWIISCVESFTRSLQKKATLLDVGAGDRNLFKKLESVHDLISYSSQDIDDTHFHEYTSMKDIKTTFDFVVSCEVIEHLDAVEKCEFIHELYRVTAPGGWLVISTPNAQHPTIFWRDFSHVMPIHYYDLAGLIGRSGCDGIGVFRIARMNFKKRLTALVFSSLLELLHIDFAQSICVVGQKPL
jgi:SAM-dependent methyltransferase